MAEIRAKEIQQSEILHLEAEMNNLWGELNTATISHHARMELEGRLSGCEEQFKAVLGGTASMEQLQKDLHYVDVSLAFAMIHQAEEEIPKAEHSGSVCQALENIENRLKHGDVSPIRARHEVKDIMRRHK